jgi:hypothetical protein
MLKGRGITGSGSDQRAPPLRPRLRAPARAPRTSAAPSRST